VFALIAQEYQERDQALRNETTEIVHAQRVREFQRVALLRFITAPPKCQLPNRFETRLHRHGRR
jgi:hypothetical protein